MNTNIFDQLNNDSEGEDFFEVINKPQETNQFSKIESIEPSNTKNIFESLSDQQKEEKQFGFLDTVKDIGEQIVSKGVAGFGGAYGNILDTLGLQSKEVLPGEQAKYLREFDALSKLENGEKPSVSDLMELSDNDELPRYSRLPNSQELQSLTGVGEGRTPAGRIAGRGSEFLGEGLAIPGGGVKGLASLGVSGLAGQGIREAGGPEALATGIEIGGSIIPSAFQGKVSPIGKEAKRIAEAGRSLGLNERQIAPLIQGETKTAILSKVARKGTKTKQVFDSIKEKLGDSYNTIKSSAEAKVKLPNSDQISIRKSFGDIRNELSKTLAPSPDKEAALNYIGKSLETLRDVDITPEYLVNFWQDINKSVKWNSISGGKKSLTKLKDPISNVLKKVSPELAKDFEMTNDLYSKYSQISKKLKPNLVDAFVNKGEILTAPYAGIALVTGNPLPLAGLGGDVAVRLLAREMIINPYFQNLATKLVKNFNQGSVKAVTESVKQAKEYMERKHPNEDWEFLMED